MKPLENNDDALLSAGDPEPVERVNEDSQSPVLLLCEHGGKQLPIKQNMLGLSADTLNEHIAWDIGAAAVARKVAAMLQAPLLVQRYSRLLIDCNRPPNTLASIPERSDGVIIPGNRNLSQPQRLSRQLEVFDPLDDAIKESLTRHQRKAAFSIHSFTPQMHDQQPRPWHAGFLTRTDHGTSEAMIGVIKQQRPALMLAINEPYDIDDETDWFIPRYAESNELVHCLIEIRNDQLRTDDGIDLWAELLGLAISAVTKDIN